LAPVGAAGRAKLRKILREELDAGAGWKPRVEPGGLTERRRAATADPDRWATGTMWLRLDGDVVEREVLAAEADVVAGPQRATDLEHLEESSDPTLEWHADGLELLPDGRCVGRNADAQDHTALGHTVERADDVGQHDGIAQRGQEDRRAEPDAARPCGDSGQQRQGFVTRPRGDRITDPDGIEAGGLGALGHGQHGPGLGPPGHHGLTRRKQDAELDWRHHVSPKIAREYSTGPVLGIIGAEKPRGRAWLAPRHAVRRRGDRKPRDFWSPQRSARGGRSGLEVAFPGHDHGNRAIDDR